MALAICVRMAFKRQLEAGHHDHGFQPGQGVARRVGVQRGHRAFVAGVHGLEHVERFRSAALADDDSFGPHTQGVSHQVGGGDRALAFDVRRPGFQPHHVVLLQLQFGRVFDRDDAVGVGNEARQRVQQRRLAGAGAAGNEDVQPGLDRPFQQHHHLGREGLVSSAGLPASADWRRNGEWKRTRRPAPSGGMMALKREPSSMRASTIGQVSSTRRPTFEMMRSMICIRWLLSRKHDGGLFHLAAALDIDVLRAVDQDVADRRILQQHFQRSEAEGLVEHFVDQPLALVAIQQRVFGVAEMLDDQADFAAQRVAFQLADPRQIELVDELAVDPSA